MKYAKSCGRNKGLLPLIVLKLYGQSGVQYKIYKEKFVKIGFQNFKILAFSIFSFLALPPQDNITFSNEIGSSFTERASEFNHMHQIYDSLLKKYVHDARVDYGGFISSSEQFNSYLQQLGSVNEKDYLSWSREEKLAYWINAYNAFTIKAIIDHYPIKSKFGLSGMIYPENSIRQINGVWDKLRFLAAGETVTLDEIEHEILRKEFDEPRIHFAIVCASVGCPDLLSEAYRADKIDSQLESQAAKFINNETKGTRIDSHDVKLSKIFKWFGEDFIDEYGSTELFQGRSTKERAVLNFVRKYITSQTKRFFLESNHFKISYLDYDWSLNEYEESESENTFKE